MEAEKYLVWTKRKHDEDPQILESATAPVDSRGDSWEEQAFAEDAAGRILGGRVWPPRSYSCSFCRREFRSAQALGGHMNVHRRDRARLKQSPNTIPSAGVASFDSAYSSQTCTLLYNINPNPESWSMALMSPPSNTIRVSSQAATHEKASALCLLSPLVQQRSKNNLVSEKNDCVLDLIKNAGHETDSLKRRRRFVTKPTLSSFSEKLSSVNDRVGLPPSNLLKWPRGSVDDLDLELRLGNAPKVN